MEASKVYFADFRTTLTENLQQKLWRLLDKAGMGTIDFDKKYAAIKMHFGSRVIWRFCVRTGQRRLQITSRHTAASPS